MQMSFCWLWRLFDFSLISASFNFYQLFKELHQNLSGAQLLIQKDPAALFICRCCDHPYRFSNKPYEPQKCYMFHSIWNPKRIIFPSFISHVTGIRSLLTGISSGNRCWKTDTGEVTKLHHKVNAFLHSSSKSELCSSFLYLTFNRRSDGDAY